MLFILEKFTLTNGGFKWTINKFDFSYCLSVYIKLAEVNFYWRQRHFIETLSVGRPNLVNNYQAGVSYFLKN